jgi:hypothetical protein
MVGRFFDDTWQQVQSLGRPTGSRDVVIVSLYLERGDERRMEGSSVVDRHIPWIDIRHKYSIVFEFTKNGLNFGPVGPELLRFFGVPSGEHILRVVRQLVEIGTREIEKEGPSDDRHFDDPQVVVVVDQLRNGRVADLRYRMFQETEVNIPFLRIELFAFIGFNGRPLSIGLVFCDEYATMNTESQLICAYQSLR